VSRSARRRGDLKQQFLIEAVLVCMIGGALGVALALSFGVIFPLFNSAFVLDYSTCVDRDGVRMLYRNRSRLRIPACKKRIEARSDRGVGARVKLA
jgi:hypothetical protein